MAEIIRHFNGDISIEKIDCGVGHSGILISKKLFLWGMITTNKNETLKIPTKISLNSPVSDFILGDMLTII